MSEAPDMRTRSDPNLQGVIDNFLSIVVQMATHPFGCRVIQRVLEHCQDKGRKVGYTFCTPVWCGVSCTMMCRVALCGCWSTAKRGKVGTLSLSLSLSHTYINDLMHNASIKLLSSGVLLQLEASFSVLKR